MLSVGIQNSRLERISLRDNKKIKCDSECFGRLFNGQFNGIQILKYLDLRGCDLGIGIKYFMGFLSSHQSIEYLNLRDNLVTSEVLVCISDALVNLLINLIKMFRW